MTEKQNISVKGITSTCHASAIADHVTSTGHNLKWDHFEILAKGRSDTHCKIKESLLIQELKPTLNDTVSSEKLYLYLVCIFFNANFSQLLSLLLLVTYFKFKFNCYSYYKRALLKMYVETYETSS